jgi:phosphatidylserine/phosphatidylglycerophosphate/cardiolipin synthase-like enzyme
MSKTKEKIYLVIIILLIALCGQFYYSYQYQPTREVLVFYNHEKKLNREIIKLTQEADKFVYFSIYTFTRLDIKDALLAAKYRGLEVLGITDRKQTTDIELQRKIVKELRESGIEVLEHNHSAIMHTKMLITEKAYASGSFNWTISATDSNDEVLEIGYDSKIRQQYEEIFHKLFKKYSN